MNNPNSKIKILVFAIILIGAGIFILQKTNQEKLITEKEVLNSNTVAETQDAKTNEEENAATLPGDVEWLTYSDDDLSFVYPKTFLGTSMEEDFDKNLARQEWEIIRQDNTIYIKPNFESPAAEFSSTYEIKILKDTWSAEEEWSTAAQLHQGPESQWGEKLTLEASDYYVGVLRNIDFGLGEIADVYTLIPGGIDDLGKSQKPTAKHFIIYAYPNLYNSYIENILIPSI